MTQQEPTRSLKVCHTCRHWVHKYKGLCVRLDQGVGKFWFCQDWQETDGAPPLQSGDPLKS